MKTTPLTSATTGIQIESQNIERIQGQARSAASIAEMVAAAAAEVSTSAPQGGAAASTAEESSAGVQIERQDIERVQGQAKSGIND